MDSKHISRKVHHLSRATACDTYPSIVPWQTRVGISIATSAKVGGQAKTLQLDKIDCVSQQRPLPWIARGVICLPSAITPKRLPKATMMARTTPPRISKVFWPRLFLFLMALLPVTVQSYVESSFLLLGRQQLRRSPSRYAGQLLQSVSFRQCDTPHAVLLPRLIALLIC